MSPLSWLFVFLGGFIGSVARETLSPLSPFEAPWVATLVINVVASFVIGGVYALRGRIHQHAVVFGAVGFCGGFSTFSTFTHEIVDLADEQAFGEAASYVIASLVLGIAAAVAAESLVRRIDERAT